jgi:membrane dipeptidase
MQRRLTARVSAFGPRRQFLNGAGAVALALGYPGLLRAAGGPPIADAHSHIGMFSRRLAGGTLKAEMEAAGVMLLSWNIVGDSRWTMGTSFGIQQRSAPGSGEQSAYFREKLEAMRKLLASTGLAYVQKPADIDAARAGAPHVVIAVEGAGFTEDGLEGIERAYAGGLRHLQLVHYIRNGLGDFQTERPEHGGMTALGVDVVKSCNRLGILVDLAHATNPVIDKALEVSSAPVIWSHSAITANLRSWTQSTNLSRQLHVDYAKKIAQRGGAVGLWSLRSSVGGSPQGYADELMRMADAVGPEHVMFGTDLDGVGRFGVMDELADLRKVADLLARRGVDDRTLRAVCFDNYARCLRAAMEARQA